MKKLIYLLFILLLATATFAQGGRKINPRKIAQISRRSPRSPWQIPTEQLNKQVRISQQIAQQMEQAVARHRRQFMDCFPVCKTFITDMNRTRAVFPQLPAGISTHEAEKRILIEENNLFVQENARMVQEVWSRAHQLFPRFEQAIDALKNVEDPLQFVVDHLPAQTTLFFIGEVHDVSQITPTVSVLLERLRAARPNQQIILFTEFLHQWYEYTRKPSITPPGYIHEYQPIWETALRQHIRVIGMEPIPACYNDEVASFVPFEFQFVPTNLLRLGTLGKEDLFEMFTGMRYRNEEFVRTLQAYRARFPHALFVVYTGTMHVEYLAPFSVADRFPQEKKFILSLGRGKSLYKYAASDELITHALEERLQAHILDPFLYWPDEELAKVAGFDAHINVEETNPWDAH